MTDKDDILIRQFMNERMPVVEDMGFTHRVMRHLPRGANRRNRWWTIFCMAVGVLAIAATDSISILIHTVEGVWGDMLGAVAVKGAVSVPAIIAVIVVMVAAGVMINNSSVVYNRR